MNTFPILTVLTLLPFAGGLVILGLGDRSKTLPRALALGCSGLALAVALALWTRFDSSSASYQFIETRDWVPGLGIQYHVGVDGLGLLLVLLTTVVTPMAILASWHVSERPQIYHGLVLLLQSGLIGTFTALNFFHWFLFWELSLIPAFFLVRLWGGAGRVSAANQFFVYTMVGSVALLIGFLAMFLSAGTFDFAKIGELSRDGRLFPLLAAKLGIANVDALAGLVFACVCLGFAVKVPLMPFHTWLPATYAEAPAGTTMLLTGVMSKMGVYGFLRILLPIFPREIHVLRVPLLLLAVATIVFPAFAAFAQKDLKRMLAYSSINHLGYCLLGIFAVVTAGASAMSPANEKAAALNGVFLQLFNHGLTAATLFWFLSFLERRSGGARGLNDFGGLRKIAPVLCGLMGIALFSSLGLPGLNGFIGEFLIFKGVFPLAGRSAALAVIGLLATAIFILTLLQRVFNGPLNEKWSKLTDLTLRERLAVAPAIGLMFVLGLYPQLVLGTINSTVVRLVEQLKF
jgi:NADH-quinone oxidoreductase subunit M